ncbi:MAG TPA: DUF1906 domain-containing protein [Thermoanaerobaculia bacterium]|nr:DUF1906 domain-containing protein [Thermoanaerobaculia bacterium]
MTLSGCDASSACTESMISCLKENNISFVGRYYSDTTHIAGKKLTASEAQLLSSNGIDLVAVFEDAPTEASYFSASRGTRDANAALAQAASVGQPAGSAIYFTVDYDASQSDIDGVITDYFQAIAATLGTQYVTGVYGSGNTCTAILKSGHAKLAWLAQSTGWGGYQSFHDWVIKQGPEGSICGLSSDSDEAQGDFGAFRVAVPA